MGISLSTGTALADSPQHSGMCISSLIGIGPRAGIMIPVVWGMPHITTVLPFGRVTFMSPLHCFDELAQDDPSDHDALPESCRRIKQPSALTVGTALNVMPVTCVAGFTVQLLEHLFDSQQSELGQTVTSPACPLHNTKVGCASMPSWEVSTSFCN